MNEFRHNSKGKINRTIQNLTELMNFLDSKNLLEEKLYEKNIEIEDDTPDVSETIKSLMQISLNDQKFILKYLNQIKELFAEIDSVNFKIIDLVKELQEIKKNFLNKNFQFIIEGKPNEYKINAHKDYFREIIEQLIDNAEIYAFTNKNNKYWIKFEFLNNGQHIVMIYSNNGTKFNLTKDEYISMGKTTHKRIGTGYGGAMIYKYIMSFKGDFEILDFNGMKIKFYFPIDKEE